MTPADLQRDSDRAELLRAQRHDARDYFIVLLCLLAVIVAAILWASSVIEGL